MKYLTAELFLNGRDKRKYSRNTYFERINDTSIGVKLHSTFIVVIHNNDTIELNTGGWETWTTRNRINKILGFLFGPEAPRVYTTKDFMHLWEPKRRPIEFFDGMILNDSGRCINYWNRN